MTIWILVLILLVLGIGLFLCRRGKARWAIPVLLGLGVLAAVLLLLPREQPEPLPTVPETTGAALPETAPSSEATLPPETEAPPETLPPMPEDEDLPVSQVPEAYPDLHGIADLPYGENPEFRDPAELCKYLLNRLLHGQHRADFYLSRDLAPTEGDGTCLVHDCLEAAGSYYPFGAWNIYSLYAEEMGDPDRVLMHLDFRYENSGYDLEARAEALEYVLKHPVPIGGFRDADQEMEYCREIHDDLIRRISYDPIGYAPLDMITGSQYESKQEAYNVLVSEDTRAVCAGYARGFALIAQYAGIDCAFVTGNEIFEPEIESHAWNVVYPCDGSGPVTVDVTWDDPDLLDENDEVIYGYVYFYLPLDLDYEHDIHPETRILLDALHS